MEKILKGLEFIRDGFADKNLSPVVEISIFDHSNQTSPEIADQIANEVNAPIEHAVYDGYAWGRITFPGRNTITVFYDISLSPIERKGDKSNEGY